MKLIVAMYVCMHYSQSLQMPVVTSLNFKLFARVEKAAKRQGFVHVCYQIVVKRVGLELPLIPNISTLDLLLNDQTLP